MSPSTTAFKGFGHHRNEVTSVHVLSTAKKHNATRGNSDTTKNLERCDSHVDYWDSKLHRSELILVKEWEEIKLVKADKNQSSTDDERAG
jgi:hypothetical protein